MNLPALSATEISHCEGHHDFLPSCDVFLAIQLIILMVKNNELSVYLVETGGKDKGKYFKKFETDCVIFSTTGSKYTNNA